MSTPRAGSKPPSRAVREAEERQTPVQDMDGYELTRALTGGRKLGSADPKPPAPAGLLLMRIVRETHSLVADLEEKRNEVLTKHGLRRNGKLIEGAVPLEKQEAALKEIRALYTLKHEVRCRPVKWSQFEGQDIDSTAFADLGPLGIDDADEAD